VQQHGWELAHQVLIDSTIMRTHQHTAGARKKTVDKESRPWAALEADFPPNYMLPAPMNTQVSA